MSGSGVGVSLSDKTRAQRFELHIPLQYRTLSDESWHKGTTRNISRSGMLFRGEDWAEPRTHIELTLSLPRRLGADRAAEVVCRGMVTRAERQASEMGGLLIAIRISHYRLIRPKDVRQSEEANTH